MQDIKIPKDIEKYKTRLVGPLSLRQTLCFSAGALIAFFLCRPLFSMIDQSLASIISIIVMSPFLACGWIEQYGMPFEQFFIRIFLYNLLTPRKRIFKNTNIIEKTMTEKEQKKKQKMKKKAKRYKSKDKELKRYC